MSTDALDPPGDVTAPDLQLFRTIFEQSPISIQIFTPDGLSVGANRAWEELWGIAHARLGEYNVLRDAQLVQKGIMPYIERAFAGETVDVPAVRYVPDESVPDISMVPYRWVEAFAYPVRDGAGTTVAVVLSHRDVTAEREMELAVRSSEALFRSVFESAPVGIALIDEHDRYVAVNPVRAAMLGYAQEELLGRHYLEITDPEDVQLDQEINTNARQLGIDHFQFEKRFLRKDGSSRWTRITVARVPGVEPTRWISITEDISTWKEGEAERARLLEQLTTSLSETASAERLLQTVVEHLPVGLLVTNRAGNVIMLNDTGRQIAGTVPDQTLPLAAQVDSYDVRRGFGVGPLAPEDTPIAQVLRGETLLNQETVFRRPTDGRDLWLRISGVPLLDADGAVDGAVVAFQDVTAFHLLEQQKTEFLSAVAHDLRTPLTSIKGRAQIVERRLARPDPDLGQMRDDARRIETAVGRMMALVTNLLDVANIELGRGATLARRPTDLVALARSATEQYEGMSERHSFRFESPLQSLIGTWDPDRLERVIANLLSNAVKYSPDGGEIVVTVGQDSQQGSALATLSVADPGIGIAPDDRERIFERFIRGTNIESGVTGAGIGLSVVKEIVDQHGGCVTVSSTPGMGTVFEVRLPLEPR